MPPPDDWKLVPNSASPPRFQGAHHSEYSRVSQSEPVAPYVWHIDSSVTNRLAESTERGVGLYDEQGRRWHAAYSPPFGEEAEAVLRMA